MSVKIHDVVQKSPEWFALRKQYPLTLPWQSVYAEMVFMDVLWPDVDRRTLWKAIEIYNERDRRFGKA